MNSLTHDVACRLHKGDRKARDEMIRDHLGMVREIASSYQGRGVEDDDLFQEGCLGLIHAVETTDYFTESFSSNASAAIRQAIRKAIEKHDLSRIPVSRPDAPRTAPPADEAVMETDAFEHVLTLIQRLDPRERTIMLLRFRLNELLVDQKKESSPPRKKHIQVHVNNRSGRVKNDKCLSCKEVGNKVRLTKARVSQIVLAQLAWLQGVCGK